MILLSNIYSKFLYDLISKMSDTFDENCDKKMLFELKQIIDNLHTADDIYKMFKDNYATLNIQQYECLFEIEQAFHRYDYINIITKENRRSVKSFYK